MLNPFIDLISTIIHLYNFILLIWVVVSLLINFDILNRYQPFVQKLSYALDRLTAPLLRPIRRFMPDLGGIDISPIVLILLLNFLDSALRHYLYDL